MSLRRNLLWPLVPVYAAALAVRRQTRSLLASRRRALPNVVISVGSVSAGGAGKTPVVLLLAGMLHRRDYAVRILTRGYGRDGTADRSIEHVDPAGSAARFGDEPLLLAQRTGVPVFVGADRYQAGLLAEATSPAPPGKVVVHLLDDGFQHRSLARDIDIVLLTAEDLTDRLLPAGNLREPLATLRDADVILVREDETASLAAFLTTLNQPATGSDADTDASEPASRPTSPRIWRIRRSLRLPSPELRAHPHRPFAFCGIGRPDSFLQILEAHGLPAAAHRFFPDHHRYEASDIDRLLAAARSHAADGFVTTEKDAVKLSPAMRRQLESIGPLLVPELAVDLLDEREALEQLISMVSRLDRRRRR